MPHYAVFIIIAQNRRNFHTFLALSLFPLAAAALALTADHPVQAAQRVAQAAQLVDEPASRP